ncbi:MAG: hypothetical protein U0R64_04705 [Candidatus Nanopelagicales bacterium]
MTWVLALHGLAHEAVVVRQLTARAPRRVTDIVELLAVAQPAVADLVLVSARFPQMNRETAARISEQVPCYGVADAFDDPAVHRLVDWGLPVIRVDANCDLAQAVAAVERPAAASPVADAPLVVVTGTHGAPGRTTVAAALATALAPSMLIDGDLVSPAVGFHCGVSGGADLLSAANAAGVAPLEPAGLLAAAAECGPVAVITGVAPGDVRDLGLAGATAVVDAARRTGRTVVVDAGAGPCVPEELGALRAMVLARATRVLSVAVPTALGIRRWVDGAGDLPQDDLTVVWNRVPRRGPLGSDPLSRLAQVVGRIAPNARVAGLPDDADTARQLDGRPGSALQVAPSGRLALSVATLAADLVGDRWRRAG